MKILVQLCVILLFFSGCASFKKADLPAGNQIDAVSGNYYTAQFSETSGLNYLITFPAACLQDTNKKWPVILFLHSMEERGSDISLLINNTNGEGQGLAYHALTNSRFAFITVSPLCPANTYWPMIDERLNSLLQELVQKYPLQPARICLTGVSMGGIGTWSLAMKYPGWFAAIAPVSGGIYSPPMTENIQALSNIPVWAFHDRYDPNIHLDQEIKSIGRMQKNGNPVTYTISEKHKHYIHHDIYADGKLFQWFLTKSRSE